jgi:hypothetical protein
MGSERVAHPSRLAQEGEHLRMTVPYNNEKRPGAGRGVLIGLKS